MDSKRKPKEKKEHIKEKLRLKRKKSKKNKHRARLVVYNLPFATTEENLREHFEKFGEIDEIKLLKKENGTLVGCGFVQFKLVQKAAKARYHCNGKPFLDREIKVDWALAKDKYVKEYNKVESVKIKEEPIDDEHEPAVTVKTEVIDFDSIKAESAKEDLVNCATEEGEENDLEEEEDVMEEEDYGKVTEKEDCNNDEIDNVKEVKPRVISNDASEGKTIFIKNVPFAATNEDLKSCFAQFGLLYYALVCIDPLTEHSKGTAFVKFKNKQDADECLAAPKITLMGNTLECQYALTKDELKRKSNEGDGKNRNQKDSRNLYLVKEGVVLAGSKAAEGVSAADMAKRLQVEQYKTSMLKNLNMIVARTRLIVHNIPESWDDSKLRTLFKKHVDPNAIIKEAKIMRNMRLVDGRGVGKSKGFGFVTFTTHEAALTALRAINNNPNIFSVNKRPIVAFSIENRAKLKVKERRLENSRLKNPTYKNYDPNAVKKPKNNKVNKELKNWGTKRTHDETNVTGEQSDFVGVVANVGNKKMRSKFNLKMQARLHNEQLKKEKKKKKFAKKSLQQKQKEFTKQPRQKINKKKQKVSDNFSRLVNDYKQKLLNAVDSVALKKKKWFE